MSYTSQTRIERSIGSTLLIQLTDDSGAGSVDSDVLNQAIESAGNEIDGYIQAHYSVPLATTPGMIQVIADDLTVYYLYYHRRNSFGIPDGIWETYKMRIKQLEKINDGKIDLGVEPPPSKSSKVMAQSDGPTAVMTGGANGSLKDF